MKTIIYNGKIFLEKGNFSSAICIEDNLVLKTGNDDEILALYDENTTKIDAKGSAVLPGFNDSHMHLYALGRSLQSVRLYGSTSIEDVIKRAKDFITENKIPKGEIISGTGWNQDYFTDFNRMLTKYDLDKISTEHIIVFDRACGHASTCNSKALEYFNITKDTPQIDGAEFYYDTDGTPNGIFTENAIKILLKDKFPKPSTEKMTETIKLAMEYALSQGITSIQTNDISENNYMQMYNAYQNIYDENIPASRSYHQCFFTDIDKYKQFLKDGFKTGTGSDFNKIGPLKMFIDGSLGARTALMREFYADDNSTKGICCMTQEYLDEMVKTADENMCQVAVHAIGDRGIEMVLNSYDNIIENENKLRHSVIHCQITDKPLLERFKNKGILAQVQPIFIHYDMHIVKNRVGEELADTSYAFGSMHKMEIDVSYGTDCPVEDLKTFDNLYCAITRKDLTGKNCYNKEESVSLEDAIMLYTKASAYASFDEEKKGKLLPNYVADLVILDRDIFNMDLEKLRETKVVLTMVDGKIQYSI